MFIVLNRVLFNEFSISNNIQSSLKRKLTTRLTFGHPYRRCVDIVVCMCVSVISLYAYSHHCIYSIRIWHIKLKNHNFLDSPVCVLHFRIGRHFSFERKRFSAKTFIFHYWLSFHLFVSLNRIFRFFFQDYKSNTLNDKSKSIQNLSSIEFRILIGNECKSVEEKQNNNKNIRKCRQSQNLQMVSKICGKNWTFFLMMLLTEKIFVFSFIRWKSAVLSWPPVIWSQGIEKQHR